MKRGIRTLTVLALSASFACALADQAFVNVSAFPTISVADGRSTTTVSAEVRDSSGRLVGDGTRVLFTTTLGNFRESIASTVNGVARAVLIAGGAAGTATVTATAIGLDAKPTSFEFEFVSDRSLLSTAQEYVEIVAADYMQYTGDSKIIGAASPKQGVSVRYHDLDLVADDIQLNTQTMELRARHARLKYGSWSRDFEELYLRLTQRKGLGLTTYTTKRWDGMASRGRWIAFVRTGADGHAAVPDDEDRFGVVEIRPGVIKPTNSALANNVFEFKDLSASPSTVSAKKAVVFPRKEVQFQRADIYVSGNKVLKVPLYAVSLVGSNSPLVTDQMVSVNNNQLALNYPYYLTLQPGRTSLLRFRTGTQSGRGFDSMRGVFLDYELNWNRGDNMQGSFTMSGLARDDWNASLKQYLRIDDKTDASAQIDLPQGQSIYGSANLSRQFTGFQMNMSANANRTLHGLPFNREDYTFTAEKDPTKAGKLPVQLYYGFVAQSSRASYSTNAGDTQSYYGLRLRGQTSPLSLIDRHSNISLGFSVSKLVGVEVNNGIAISGTAALSRQLGAGASMVATYDYVRDGFNEYIMGKHRMSLQGFFDRGKTHLSLLGSRSMDMDRMSISGDLSYRLSGLWRLDYGYLFDHYINDTYSDQSFLIGYRIGWREIGLTYSQRLNRLGVQLLGASF